VIKTVPGTSSAYAERGIGGYYLEIAPDREALARYGILIQDVQDTIAAALGGQTVTTTVEGRQRFTQMTLSPLPNGFLASLFTFVTRSQTAH
jgi:Cu(I)/Ag(I) efflux system membrane protein CusA/SilA